MVRAKEVRRTSLEAGEVIYDEVTGVRKAIKIGRIEFVSIAINLHVLLFNLFVDDFCIVIASGRTHVSFRSQVQSSYWFTTDHLRRWLVENRVWGSEWSIRSLDHGKSGFFSDKEKLTADPPVHALKCWLLTGCLRRLADCYQRDSYHPSGGYE